MQFNAATASINPTLTEIAELKVPKALPNFGSNKTFHGTTVMPGKG